MKYINFNQNIDKLRDSFNDSDKPYRYIILDNFFNEEYTFELSDNFPKISDDVWIRPRHNLYGKKNIFEQKMISISNYENLPFLASEIFDELNSEDFVELLKKITGISNLIEDSYNKIGNWAGLRAMLPGGYQAIHSDARIHPNLGLEKKITLVGYLNNEWKKEDKGELEIWENDMSKKYEEIPPMNNRVIIFENGDTSYHGVPEVKSFRKSFLASYLIDDKNFIHSRAKAKFVRRPNEGNEKLWKELSEMRESIM